LIRTIPSTIGQLSSLQFIVFASNQLSGIVPTSLCQISVINNFYFTDNMFECYPACLLYPKVKVLSPGSTPLCASDGNSNIPPLERQALHDLYNSTDGSNWNYYGGTHWNFSNPNANPCDIHWYGVICSVEYHIIRLSVVSSNLIGAGPGTIGQLLYLQELWLHSNQLNGTIPSMIGYLSSLVSLSLNSNLLSGSIPSTIGN
jgi:Leucine-rich repeat (LRR) protein